jgi:hypothetical protein
MVKYRELRVFYLYIPDRWGADDFPSIFVTVIPSNYYLASSPEQSILLRLIDSAILDEDHGLIDSAVIWY